MNSLTSSAAPPETVDVIRADHLKNLREVAGNFSPWILLLPAALCAWIGTNSTSPWWEYTLKPYQEFYGPLVLAVASTAAIGLWLSLRGFYYRWLTLLSLSLLCREIHFQGTSTGIYFVIPLLFWYASLHFRELQPYAGSRLLVSLLAGAFVTYFFTITVDRAVWKFLPHHDHWRNNIEETLETLGHAMILATILLSPIYRHSAQNLADEGREDGC